MRQPLISVVLPVYNGEKYLRESIDSVLSQDEADFEFIIWDDDSSDASPLIINDYRDRTRQFANASNLGLFRTLNLAIQESRGEWIRLWSQDDVMKPCCLRTESQFISDYSGLGMAYCAVDTIDENGNIISTATRKPTPNIVSSQLAAEIMFFHGSIAGNISNVLLKRSILSEIGYFREDMRISADFEMWVRVCQKYPLGYISEPLVNLRNHAGQFSRARNSFETSIEEDQLIYKKLMTTLPSEMRNYCLAYHRWYRGTMYWHHLVRRLMSLDFSSALRSYRTIRLLDVNPILLALFWLLTANQHFYRMKPRYTALPRA